jgi:uncharacterized YkwD family protein
MNKKIIVLMTSLVVFVIMAIVVSTMDFNLLNNSDLIKSENQSSETETRKDITQQTNENKEVSSDITSTNDLDKQRSLPSSGSIEENKSPSSRAADNGVTNKTNKPSSSTTQKPSSSSSQQKPSQSSTPSKPAPSQNFSEFQTKVLELVNQERAKVGLNPLTLNAKLSSVATQKSQDMADLGYFDHTSPTYGSPFDMMKQFGVSYQSAGENIAKGQTSPEQVMNGWMNSDGHRANILNSSFTQLGVGVVKNANGQLIWTQMFIG